MYTRTHSEREKEREKAREREREHTHERERGGNGRVSNRREHCSATRSAAVAAAAAATKTENAEYKKALESGEASSLGRLSANQNRTARHRQAFLDGQRQIWQAEQRAASERGSTASDPARDTCGLERWMVQANRSRTDHGRLVQVYCFR